MILSAIAAMAKNRVIGKNNQLPWHVPEDLKFFRETTKGKVLIMGRKTFESLPGLLPGRAHIVITRQTDYIAKLNSDLVFVVGSFAEAVALARKLTEGSHPMHRLTFSDEVFVVGGAEIYKESLPVLDKIYLTTIEQEIEGDAFFPEFDQSRFEVISRRASSLDGLHYEFVTFARK